MEREVVRTHRLAWAVVTYESDFRLWRMGRGSVGLDIFGFLADPVLERGSAEPDGTRGLDELLLNHLDGLDSRLPRLGEGDRGNCWAVFGDGGTSAGLSVLKLPFLAGMMMIPYSHASANGTQIIYETSHTRAVRSEDQGYRPVCDTVSLIAFVCLLVSATGGCVCRASSRPETRFRRGGGRHPETARAIRAAKLRWLCPT
jgi:hypothetical protein